MAPRISAASIIEKWNLVTKGQQTEEYFYNKVLGLPFASSDSTVSEETILGSITTEVNPMDGRVIIGLDTGIKLRFVIGNRYGIIGYGERDDWEPRETSPTDPRPSVGIKDTIEGLLHDFPNSIMVIDAGGDIIGTRKMQEKYPGRVFLCFFRNDRKSQTIIRWGEGAETGTVVVDRNRMLSLLVGEFKEGRVRLYNGSRSDYYDYWLHWSHIRRTVEENNLGMPEYKWIRVDRDDFVLATGYWRIGLDRFGEAASISGAMPELKPNSYMVSPNRTVSIDTNELFDIKFAEKEDDWRNN
jgi:hypothetical protein